MTLLYKLLQEMCKQITNIHSIRSDKVRHLGFPAFRASAQGGDRYPKHGTKTEEGQIELAKRVSDVHAAAVTQRIKSLNCPTSQKLELLDAVIETVKERSREQT